MFANVSDAGLQAATFVAAVCPQAPPGAQAHVDNILGYVLWGVGILFFLGVIIAVAAIAGGRMFGMPHASTGGIIGLVIVFIAVIAYLILPGILDAMMGTGCV
ncbi:hypothetical protein BJF81_00300 [Ornithinimicrobium sp. CNJ-824]|uniref:hypothetical protein n=1 Tax=Ornithinimicrobium sp. CNJ-824 TaxID=1904966 RepID=UPI00095EA5B5|nr:hypothetical protein [Ornithinimicrobium sp. CNJ-824]OLT22344.1 hypothetical protein BJF81_00300 [Ornithinimicrobium sp. CNJ-824]RIK08991.1 MAG: hypothetical protein DCC50_15390 [Acidobacteriota bacterium]